MRQGEKLEGSVPQGREEIPPTLARLGECVCVLHEKEGEPAVNKRV